MDMLPDDVHVRVSFNLCLVDGPLSQLMAAAQWRLTYRVVEVLAPEGVEKKYAARKKKKKTGSGKRSKLCSEAREGQICTLLCIKLNHSRGKTGKSGTGVWQQ